MAKHTCAICGAEVGLMFEQKLADGNYICRKVCSKKTFKVFDKVSATLDEAQAAGTVEAIDASVYGDRTQWIAKADAALAPYNQ